LLQVIDLDSETVSGTGNRPAVRRLYAVSRAVVVVVDLRGIEMDRAVHGGADLTGGMPAMTDAVEALRNGEPIVLTPKVFDLLALLVQGRGRILKKEELMSTLWPKSFVEEGNLSQSIFLLKRRRPCRFRGLPHTGRCLAKRGCVPVKKYWSPGLEVALLFG